METKGKTDFDYGSFQQSAIERLLAEDSELGDKDGLIAPLLKDMPDGGKTQASVLETVSLLSKTTSGIVHQQKSGDSSRFFVT
jgi:hypothetical protein